MKLLDSELPSFYAKLKRVVISKRIPMLHNAAPLCLSGYPVTTAGIP